MHLNPQVKVCSGSLPIFLIFWALNWGQEGLFHIELKKKNASFAYIHVDNLYIVI